VSVLRNRIIAPHAEPGAGPAYTHPGGTAATPMMMPLALVTYHPGSSRYDDLHAQPATGDPNAVPLAVLAPGTFGKVVPAGTA
jgi:hypothetical protein